MTNPSPMLIGSKLRTKSSPGGLLANQVLTPSAIFNQTWAGNTSMMNGNSSLMNASIHSSRSFLLNESVRSTVV